MKNIYFCFTIIVFSFFAKAQNVGIGESNPIYKLDINGDLRVQGNVVRGGSSGSFNIISNGGFRIDLDDDNNGSESFRIANGSNTVVFEVFESGNIEGDGNALFDGNLTLNGSSRIISSGDALDISSTSGMDVIIDSDASGTGSEFYIKRDGVSGTNLFRVDEDGDATIYRKLRITPLASAPTGTKGDMYFDNVTNKLYYHDGTAWREVVNTNNISAAIATLSESSGGGLNAFSYNGGSAVQIGIANSGVDNGKIANDAVTSNKIQDGTIANADIADGTINLTTKVSNVLPVANGGSGVNTVTGILQGNGSSAFTGITATSGNHYLRRNSANTAFEFGQIDYSHLANQLTAGTGISISSGTVTNTGVRTASNGLNVVSNDVRLGGSLTGATTITQDGAGEVFTIANNSADNTIVNLQSSGDFVVQDNGTTMFRVRDDGRVDIGDVAGTNNNLFISNQIIDMDDNSYFLDPGSDSRLNEIHADLGSVSDVSYTFGGDDNTGMWSAGADILSFSTAGAERLRIGSTGNVGIGTTPDANHVLTVNGRMFVNSGVIQMGGSAITTTSDLGLYSGTNGAWMRFVTNAAPTRFYQDNGAGTNAVVSIETGKSPRVSVDGAVSAWGIVPIGTITAWVNHLSGTPALPAGWVECNGQTLSDSESPLNGRVIPNLNNTPSGTFGTPSGGYYLRGTTGTTGGTQGDRAPNFEINQSSSDQGVESGSVTADGATQNYSGWLNNYYLSDSFRFRYTGGEVRPVTYTVRWIMRIK